MPKAVSRINLVSLLEYGASISSSAPRATRLPKEGATSTKLKSTAFKVSSQRRQNSENKELSYEYLKIV